MTTEVQAFIAPAVSIDDHARAQDYRPPERALQSRPTPSTPR